MIFTEKNHKNLQFVNQKIIRENHKKPALSVFHFTFSSH